MYLLFPLSSPLQFYAIEKLQMQVHAGMFLNGYHFLKLIGEGGYSSVFTVNSHRFNRVFVAKVMHVDETDDADQSWEAFDCEIKALLRLDHPNIIRLYEHFRHGDHFILILEHCENGSLDDYIQTHGPMTGRSLTRAIRELCSAMNYTWAQGVQHRDIKPENIMFDENWRVKLLDFGISMIRKDESEHVTDFRCSRSCAAPQILTRTPHDPIKSDIWAVGVTILWMALGDMPWACEKYSDMEAMIKCANYRVPEDMDSAVLGIVRKMVVVEERNRVFPSDRELNELFSDVCVGKSMTQNRLRPMIMMHPLGTKQIVGQPLEAMKSKRQVAMSVTGLKPKCMLQPRSPGAFMPPRSKLPNLYE